MIGADYASYDDFMAACGSRRESLDPSRVLGKIYPIEQLRELAEHLGISADQINEIVEEGEGGDKRGVTRRYDCARAIAQLRTAEQIEEALSYLDHTFYFPVLSYLRLSGEVPHNSPKDLLNSLKDHYTLNNDSFQKVFNGLTNPAGAACKLESIRIHGEDSASLLFSCTRVLLAPEGQIGNYNEFFLARVPVLAYFFFSRRLLEISMPTFSEAASDQSGATRIPERYQIIIQSMQPIIGRIAPGQLGGISFKKLTLFLETQLGAIDMGWKIEPEQEAAFDFTQNVVPLKKILDTFSQSLQTECERRECPYPLANTNLYNLFRALKEQSYTYSLLLQAPLRNRNGNVKASTLYGPPNTGYPPVLLLDKNNNAISNNLIKAVEQSQTEEIENPYDLDKIFQEGVNDA